MPTGEPVAEEGVSLNGDATNGTGDIESTRGRHHAATRLPTPPELGAGERRQLS